MEKFKFLKNKETGRLTDKTGVYAFKSKNKIVYIGKAINIKKRVKQHNELLKLAERVGYTETGSEIEALILEANLIKKHQPKYNTAWKDDKRYFYVEITKENFPRVFITHQPEESSSSIGPFVDGTSLKKTLTFLRKAFPHYSAKHHPKKNCLWCQLGLCPGSSPEKSEYKKNINNLISVLKGESKKVLRKLKKEMEDCSKAKDYEKARRIRNKIISLEKVIFHAKIFKIAENTPQYLLKKILGSKKPIERIEAYDISNIQGKEATGSMVTFISGFANKNLYRKFKIKTEDKPNDVGMLKEVLSRRFKHLEWGWPDLILIDGGRPQLNAAISSKLQTPAFQHIKVAAIAKKNNELFIEGRKNPIMLKNLPQEIFNLILLARDEAHRFAIAYHHKLRAKHLIK